MAYKMNINAKKKISLKKCHIGYFLAIVIIVICIIWPLCIYPKSEASEHLKERHRIKQLGNFLRIVNNEPNYIEEVKHLVKKGFTVNKAVTNIHLRYFDDDAAFLEDICDSDDDGKQKGIYVEKGKLVRFFLINNKLNAILSQEAQTKPEKMKQIKKYSGIEMPLSVANVRFIAVGLLKQTVFIRIDTSKNQLNNILRNHQHVPYVHNNNLDAKTLKMIKENAENYGNIISKWWKPDELEGLLWGSKSSGFHFDSNIRIPSLRSVWLFSGTYKGKTRTYIMIKRNAM